MMVNNQTYGRLPTIWFIKCLVGKATIERRQISVSDVGDGGRTQTRKKKECPFFTGVGKCPFMGILTLLMGIHDHLPGFS